jgi:TolB protein
VKFPEKIAPGYIMDKTNEGASGFMATSDPFEQECEVGSVGQAGSCKYDAAQQAFTICGAGANIWGQQDACHFVWRRMRGDFIVTARGGLVGEGAHPHRKFGWMARGGLDASAPQVCTALHGDGLAALQFRRAPGGPTEEVRADKRGADVFQLERKGNTFIMSAARYGEPFTSVQVSELELGDELYLGLFVCSHEDEVIEQAVFSNVRIVAPAGTGFERGRDPFASRLEILDAASGLRRVIYSADEVFEAPNWTRDGGSLIFNREGRLVRYDLVTGAQTLIDTGDVVRNNNDHVLSFDGSMLAISSHAADWQSRVFTVPLSGGQPTQVTPDGPSYLHGWSPDGQYLVFTGLRRGDYDIYRVPAAGGPEVQLTSAPGLDDGPEYTPDGAYIYFNSVRSGLMQIWRMRPDGSAQEQLTDDEYNNWFPHISPDGKQVVFLSYLPGEVSPSDHPAAKRVYLRLMPLDGGEIKVLAYLYGGQGTMNVPSWSPDGKQLAFVSNTVPFS